MARKILLADDSVTAQNMGRKILADAGYDVVTVNNGSAALKRIAEVKPDLIVLDVYMPGYSGLEVCQRLKDSADTENIPVLLTVGKLEPFKAEEARRVRADAHIVKPFEATELLTVIARLEDRMVPQQSEGARFSSSASGVERFGSEGSGRKTESNADADTGWKSRLRFPSKKKKEEPEPEPEEVAAGAAFREFRKRKGQTGESGAFTEKAPPVQEPGLVPDIPRDITPEELDALSAVAAQLDGPIPAAENIAPLADRTKLGPVEAPAAELAAAEETEVEVPAAAADAKKEVEAPALAVEAPALAAEGKSEVGIPVEPVEPASEVAAVVADPAAVVAVAVNTALFAQEPAPMDRDDEPMFASPASAVESAAEGKAEEQAEEKIEVKQAEAVATTATIETTEANAPAEVVAAKDQESKPEESKAEKTAQSFPVAASVPETEAEELAPSDAELAEALRLLTPAAGHADVSTVPSRGGLVAGQLLAEEAARNAAAGSRWVAEPVTLSPEEAAISLEAEMFRTFATTPASMSAATSGGEMEPVRITGVSAIAAAVENRLAEAGLAAVPEASTEPGAEHGPSEQDSVRHASSEHASETTAAETPAMEAPAEVMTAASDAASPTVDGIEVEKIAPEKIEPEKIEPEKIEAEQKDSPAKVVEEAPAEEVAAATFADAVGKDEVEATAEQNEEPVRGTTAAVAEENQDSSSDAGGQESMGKDVKAKSGKSNWHQIHTTPASAAASSDVETAKQEHGVEEAPKAMAAAASAEGGTGSISATDASTIASIVDSVMADLRPKIVEEIAKKLAKRD